MAGDIRLASRLESGHLVPHLKGMAYDLRLGISSFIFFVVPWPDNVESHIPSPTQASHNPSSNHQRPHSARAANPNQSLLNFNRIHNSYMMTAALAANPDFPLPVCLRRQQHLLFQRVTSPIPTPALARPARRRRIRYHIRQVDRIQLCRRRRRLHREILRGCCRTESSVVCAALDGRRESSVGAGDLVDGKDGFRVRGGGSGVAFVGMVRQQGETVCATDVCLCEGCGGDGEGEDGVEVG